MTNSKHVHLYWGGPLLFGPPQCIFLGGSGPPRPPRESTRLQGGIAPPIFVFAPRFISCPQRYFFGRKKLLFWPEKTFKFVISARKSLRISAKIFFGDHMIFTESSPQSNSGIMKIWAKFNAGFQFCPPDFNFAPPPRSREAGDAPAYTSFSLCFLVALSTERKLLF